MTAPSSALIEHRWITKRAEEFARKNEGKINPLLRAVSKTQVQREGGNNLNGLHAADAMAHRCLRKWFDWHWCSPMLQPVPVVQQFLLMQFSPGFDQAPLTRG